MSSKDQCPPWNMIQSRTNACVSILPALEIGFEVCTSTWIMWQLVPLEEVGLRDIGDACILSSIRTIVPNQNNIFHHSFQGFLVKHHTCLRTRWQSSCNLGRTWLFWLTPTSVRGGLSQIFSEFRFWCEVARKNNQEVSGASFLLRGHTQL